MDKKTVLYDAHVALGAQMVSFSGWLMPLAYGSQIAEHHAVREYTGVFDVSHMQVIDVSGSEVKSFLQFVLANDVAKLMLPGKALYTCLLNEQGGIIDDLLVYYCSVNNYRCVVNAATCEKDLRWLKKQAMPFGVSVELKTDLSILAVQGPEAINIIKETLPRSCAVKLRNLQKFCFFKEEEYFISRTGYTGEDGVELILPHCNAVELWNKLIALNISPCGLGARDTLRLEAGLNLSGTDMDEKVSPLEANLGWTLSLTNDRDFIGKQAILQQKENPHIQRMVGLVLKEKGVLRNGQIVKTVDGEIGKITSGSYAPSLQQAIALARIPGTTSKDCWVKIRNDWKECLIVRPPFIKNHQPNFRVSKENEHDCT